MLSGKFPFLEASEKDPKYKLIIEGKFDKFWSQFEKYASFTEDVQDLLNQMLEYDPAKRIRLTDIALHQWLDIVDHVDHADQLKQRSQRTHKRPVNKRGLLLGDHGGTLSDQDEEGFVITLLERRAYTHDGREMEIL